MDYSIANSAGIRVAHLITGLGTGGAELALARLIPGLERRGIRNHVISLIRPGPTARPIQQAGATVSSLDMRPGRPSLSALPRLAAQVRAFRPDILQTWLYHANLLGTLASSVVGPRAVLWNIRSSDMDMSHYRRLSGWTVRACARLSGLPAAVVINSQAGLEYHAALGYRPRRWVVIPNGIDTDVFRSDAGARAALREELRLPPDTLLIGYVARLDPMKDHTTFFEAARLILGAEEGVHFIVCGEGMNPENPAMVGILADPGIRSRVHFLGRREDIPRLTAALDLATLASAFGEGFPTVVAEAMASGVPCVVTDVGDAADIVGHTGRVVPRRDPQALAQGWLELMRGGRDARLRLGQEARLRVEERYSLGTMIDRYLNLYGEFLGG
jgi:glycosyltransferase involved in cell wall biosynthesis